MQTRQLYYEDTYMVEFDAEVLACEEFKGGYRILLSATAFFPEGGGQVGDVGTIGSIQVTDTRMKDGEIWHMTSEPIKTGEKVHAMIDWEKRFERMQQHTAEHIISGIIHERFGYDNVGFHLSDDICTLDLNGPLTREELEEIEAAANEAVFRNVPVQILYPTREELQNITYRSKIEIEGQVRIVNVTGYDICACCATHVSRTGEIGLIKFIHTQNYKGGVRITIACGKRALRDYLQKEKSIKAIMLMLSAKEEIVAEAVEHLRDENSALKGKLMNAQREVIAAKASGITADAEKVCVFDENLEGNGPRELMNLVLAKGVKICGVFAGTDKDGYRYVIGSASEDVRPLTKELNSAFSGRGGGKPDMTQGSLKGTKEEIQKYF